MKLEERIGRPITLRDVNILAAVVEFGSMSKAAEHLDVSQPVISKTIGDLERAIGVRLLTRRRYGVEPTVFGEVLTRRSSAAFDELRQSILEIEALSDPTRGEIRVGATPVLIESLVSEAISALHKVHPRISVDVTEYADNAPIYQNLRERKVDFILTRVSRPLLEPDFSVIPLFYENLLIVAGRNNRRFTRPGFELGDLLNEQWVIPSPTSAPGLLRAELFRSRGLRAPDAAVVTSSISLTFKLLTKGPYISLFPRSFLTLDARAASLRVIWQGGNPEQLVGIVLLQGRTISPAAQTFLEFVQSVTTAFGQCEALIS